jgi:hypothetical protein
MLGSMFVKKEAACVQAEGLGAAAAASREHQAGFGGMMGVESPPAPAATQVHAEAQPGSGLQNSRPSAHVVAVLCTHWIRTEWLKSLCRSVRQHAIGGAHGHVHILSGFKGKQ